MRAVSKALSVAGGGLLAARRPARRGRRGRPRPRRQRAVAADTRGLRLRDRQLADNGTGSGPYHEPVIGGSYGGYIGMAGNWARIEGCRTGNLLAWSPANSAQANTNFTKYHIGVGTGVYWYMGGPGVDPHWNGTTAEASNGARSRRRGARGDQEQGTITYPVVWADIELPGIEPALDNGWNSVYTSPCSGGSSAGLRPGDRRPGGVQRLRRLHHDALQVQGRRLLVPAGLDLDLRHRSVRSIPNTYEWTYWPETSNLSHRALRLVPAPRRGVRPVLRRADQRPASTR